MRSRETRWTDIYEALRDVREPMVASWVYTRVSEKLGHDVTFSTLYTDLGRMVLAGWLVEHEVLDGKARERRGFTARAGGPPVRTPGASAGLLSGLKAAFA